MGVLYKVGQWYSHQQRNQPKGQVRPVNPLSSGRIAATIGCSLLLITSKYFYLASLTSYYTFYLMEQFSVSAPRSCTCLCSCSASPPEPCSAGRLATASAANR